MDEQALVTSRACLRNVRAFTKAGNFDGALMQLRTAAATCSASDAQYLYSAAIKLCGESSQWEGALNLLIDMNRHGPTPNLVCYNAGMTAQLRCGQAQKALDLFSVVKQVGLQPDNFTCSTALKAFAMLKEWEQALSFLEVEMPRLGVEPNAHAYCAAINACEKGGQWLRAIDLFNLMQKRGVQPNTVTCTSVICACKAGGHWQDALTILHSMPSLGVQPDAHTYTNAISACNKAGKWMLAQTTFDEMRANGVEATLVTYGALLSACENGRQWKTALSILNEMPMKPDRVAYSAVIGACNKANRWAEAISVLDKMDSKKVYPDQKACDMVARVCVKCAQYDQARKVILRSRQYGIEVSAQIQGELRNKQRGDAWSEEKPLDVGLVDSSNAQALNPTESRDESIEAWKVQAMRAWREGGNWPEAIAFLKSQEYAGATPPAQAGYLDDALCASAKGGAWEQALSIYLDMNKSKVAPSQESVLAAAEACEAASQFKWSEMLRGQCHLPTAVEASA